MTSTMSDLSKRTVIHHLLVRSLNTNENVVKKTIYFLTEVLLTEALDEFLDSRDNHTCQQHMYSEPFSTSITKLHSRHSER